jgi:hypothetical protein
LPNCITQTEISSTLQLWSSLKFQYFSLWDCSGRELFEISHGFRVKCVHELGFLGGGGLDLICQVPTMIPKSTSILWVSFLDLFWCGRRNIYCPIWVMFSFLKENIKLWHGEENTCFVVWVIVGLVWQCSISEAGVIQGRSKLDEEDWR